MTRILSSDRLKGIHELDPKAKVLYSSYTSKYYVDACIEDGSDYGVLQGIVEHRETPNAAVDAYWHRLINCRRLVIGAFTSDRREIMFNPVTEEFVPWGSKIDATHLVT